MKKMLYGKRSECCNSPTLLVISRNGGLVTRDCIKCSKANPLQFKDIPELNCDECGATLQKYRNKKNYAYKCGHCGTAFDLAAIVPHWHEYFDDHGFKLDSD